MYPLNGNTVLVLFHVQTATIMRIVTETIQCTNICHGAPTTPTIRFGYPSLHDNRMFTFVQRYRQHLRAHISAVHKTFDTSKIRSMIAGEPDSAAGIQTMPGTRLDFTSQTSNPA
jgi:hypothetical protein